MSGILTSAAKILEGRCLSIERRSWTGVVPWCSFCDCGCGDVCDEVWGVFGDKVEVVALLDGTDFFEEAFVLTWHRYLS
jgi:hypothetical protein